MKNVLKMTSSTAFFCAAVGMMVLNGELWASLILSNPLRQILTDLPLPKLIGQTGCLIVAYLIASSLAGSLLACGINILFSKRRMASSEIALWSGRCFVGTLFCLYAFWAWRRGIVPKHPAVLIGILFLSLGFPFLLRPQAIQAIGRRKFLLLLCVLTLATELLFRAGATFFFNPSPIKTDRPNILLLTIDTLRPDHLGCYGYPAIQTPAIDALAKDGTLFQQAIAQIPHTGPSFTSILTGLYPHTHGMRHNNDPLDPSITTLPELLKREGYATSAFVSGHPLRRHLSGLDQGFDLYQDRFSYFDGFKLLRPLERLQWVNIQIERRAEDVDALVIPWIKRNAERPFFSWIHYYDPHTPYHPPLPQGLATPSLKKTLRGQAKHQWLGVTENEIDTETLHNMKFLYDQEIVYTDRSVGRLLSFLKENDLLDKTLIVFVSDHGESFGHDYLFNHAAQIYDETVRIPLIFRYPKSIPQGKRYMAQVQSIDLFPTLLSLVKIPLPFPVQGQVIDFSRPTGSPYAYFETPLAMRRRFLGFLKGIRSPHWKFIVSLSDETQELYDLQKDPDETQNVIRQFPEEAETLHRVLTTWLDQDPGDGMQSSFSDEQVQVLKSLGYLQ